MLGFLSCGISKAEFLEDEAPRLETWLKNNSHGEMAYMENHFDKRLNPALLVEGAKSVISFTYNYFPENEVDAGLKVSKYAYGRDYHKVVKKKLLKLLSSIQDKVGEVNGRAFVDSAPVLEKAWAKKSGLGWIGKNANLITKQVGSFYFLGEIILDVEFDYDATFKTDHCGSCTACIDACPTDAIPEPYVVDGSRCISYLTIELKDSIPAEFKGKYSDWIFGCDICQDVCPWNRFSIAHSESQFKPKAELMNMKKEGWEEITEDVFKNVFEGTPVNRTKFHGLKRNIDFLKK